MAKTAFFFITIFLFLGLQCQTDDSRDIQAFYYPIADLEAGKVYEYHPIGNTTMEKDYWYYKTTKEGKSTYFTGSYYDEQQNVRQFFKEEKLHNGMLLEEMKIHYRDTSNVQQSIPVEIQAGNAFPFKVKQPSGIFLYKIKWIDPFDPSVHTTLIRNRRYIGDTTYVYQGKTYECIQFELRELIENYKKGEGYAEPEYDGLEIYAKDLGLVYYRKNISENFRLEYELKNIYPLEDLGSR